VCLSFNLEYKSFVLEYNFSGRRYKFSGREYNSSGREYNSSVLKYKSSVLEYNSLVSVSDTNVLIVGAVNLWSVGRVSVSETSVLIANILDMSIFWGVAEDRASGLERRGARHEGTCLRPSFWK
jgi:hypothetical protein